MNRSKKIYDAVHGFIRFNDLEQLVIDSESFQRLHGIHQLGIAYLVYPGATHTRFEHSLGTMHLATQIFERLVAKGFAISDWIYWEQVVRLAALCHDLGHLPFSHDAEPELLGEAGHEGWTLRAIEHLQPIWDRVAQVFSGRSVRDDVIKMAIGKAKLEAMGKGYTFSEEERVLSQIITGDFFGADRIDYLLRDAQCTGVSHGLFDYLQLIEMLCVAEVDGKQQMCIEENGVESCEALLLARHFMHQRVYRYPSVKIYKYHLASFMQAFFEEKHYLTDLPSYLSLSDHEIIAALKVAARNPGAKGHKAASCLMSRPKKFRALLIPPDAKEEELREHLQNQGVDSDAFWIEPAPKEAKSGPAFFVRTDKGKVEPSSKFSQVSLTPKRERMLLVDPASLKQVMQVLNG